ncbi:MAG: dihydrodipicolinate synthase family protein [Gammaproteobacteria bacterium]|jgi:4-hydroxy-tetrahydrodipicolinate synthase|nr:dihydrodipicolinate synthase family protein [Gammaproteobacteria bacterium]MCP4881273.1 dihydrodipicolinate synthase family protein [Gammaproteobacteria bacterium]MDP6164989.1 dihydrodipicolinate synthase family protein [Gammaproteobacteria bacterium]
MQFEGIYTPVITPFADDFTIQEKAYADVITGIIDAGVQGIIVGGTTGEYYAMTKQERVRTMEIAREVTQDRVPLIAGVGALRTEDAEDYAREAMRIGADCLLLGAPYYACPTSLELARHCLSVERVTELPIMLYNFPDRTNAPMDEVFLEHVSQRASFCAIKESSGDINRLHLLARHYPHIQLSVGMDDQALEFFAWGARSWVAGASNFLPQEHYALYHACAVEKDFDKGRRIMTALLPLMKALEQGGKFVQSIKFGCELQGMFAGSVRKPLRGLTKEMRREFEVTVEVVQTTIANILAESDSAN